MKHVTTCCDIASFIECINTPCSCIFTEAINTKWLFSDANKLPIWDLQLLKYGPSCVLNTLFFNPEVQFPHQLDWCMSCRFLISRSGWSHSWSIRGYIEQTFLSRRAQVLKTSLRGLRLILLQWMCLWVKHQSYSLEQTWSCKTDLFKFWLMVTKLRRIETRPAMLQLLVGRTK